MRVLLEGQLKPGADPDDRQHGEQHQVQSVMGQQLPRPAQRGTQGQARAGEGDQAQQPQCP